MQKKCGDKPGHREKKYSCSRCGATSNKKDSLCKPEK